MISFDIPNSNQDSERLQIQTVSAGTMVDSLVDTQWFGRKHRHQAGKQDLV